MMRQIRWEARAGQGAKTAAQVLAMALLDAGKHVQAFPEYGPERRGAPMRAFNRIDDRPIRRHDTVEDPDVVVVLEASLLNSEATTADAGNRTTLLVNSPTPEDQLARQIGFPGRVVTVPADRLAADAGSSSPNVVMLGALAAALGEPDLEQLQQAASSVLGGKLSPEMMASIRGAIAAGHRYTRFAHQMVAR